MDQIAEKKTESASRLTKSGTILIIIPCFNEQNTIASVLEEIHGLPEKYDTLVIDDGSQDRSREIASARSACVSLVVNLGIGGAVQTGIRYAHDRGYDFCVQVDGDGQHPPNQIRKLLDRFKSQPANLIIGSRFFTKEGFQSSFRRRFGISVIRGAIRLCFGRTISDPTSGFRLMDRKAIALFSRHYPFDFPEPISVAYALKNELEVEEVSVTMRERGGGVSSITGWKTFSYMLRVVGYVTLLRFFRP